MTKKTNKNKVNNYNSKKVIKEQRKQIKQYINKIDEEIKGYPFSNLEEKFDYYFDNVMDYYITEILDKME